MRGDGEGKIIETEIYDVQIVGFLLVIEFIFGIS